MKRIVMNQYDEDEIRDIKSLLHNAQQSIGYCNEDKGLKCITCDKRQANYYIEQVKKIINNTKY